MTDKEHVPDIRMAIYAFRVHIVIIELSCSI